MDLEIAGSCTDRVLLPERRQSKTARLVGASFVFCVASITTMTTNKMALVSLNCPLLMVGLGQLVATMVSLLAMKATCHTTFPGITLAELKRTIPLSVVYTSSLFLGIESTRAVAFPMYVLLQWFTLLFVAAGQILVFSRYESLHVNSAVAMMQLGVLIAGVHYCSTSEYTGSVLVVLSNAVHAGYVLYAEKALGHHTGAVKLLYCNATVGLGLTLLYALVAGEVRAVYEYPHWTSRSFVLLLSLSCVCGAITTFTTVVLLRVTSTLTFAVVDGMKNLAVTYVGIYMASEYSFELPLWRLYGTHVTVAGCVFYVYYRIYYSEPQRTVSEKQRIIHV